MTVPESYKRIDAANFSLLKLMDDSPEAVLHRMVTPSEDTTFTSMGSSTHVLVEPHGEDKHAQQFTVWRDGRRYGSKWDMFKAAHADKIVLNTTEMDTSSRAARKLREHPIANELLTGEAEIALTWEDDVVRYPCKGRADWINLEPVEVPSLGLPPQRYLVDLKTTSKEIDSVERFILNSKVHCQLAMYRDGAVANGYEVDSVAVVIVSMKAPHSVRVAVLDESWLEIGRVKYREWLHRFKVCREENRWPGPEPEFVHPPQWLWDAHCREHFFEEAEVA